MSYDAVQENTETTVETFNKLDLSPPTRAERDQLKSLSKEVFGVESKYKKLFEYDHMLTTKVKELVPGENGTPGTEVEKEVPLLVAGTKVKQYVRKYRSTQEVINLLLDFKAKRDEYMAKVKAQQEEAKAKKDAEEKAKQLQEELGGSALS